MARVEALVTARNILGQLDGQRSKTPEGAAQVATALALVDIAESLRIIAANSSPR